MHTSTTTRNALLLVSVLCLATAYVLEGFWQIAPALLACLGIWVLLRRQSVGWRASGLLLGYVALAAFGIVSNLNVALLLVGTTAALGAWDLTNFEETLRVALNPETGSLLQRLHLRALSIALAAGMLLSLLAYSARLNLPFAGAVALALILVASITAAGQQLRKAA